MAEYVDRAEFLKRIEPYNTPDKTDKALYNFAFNKMMETPNADVVEREKIDKAIEEIKAESYSERIDGADCDDILIVELRDVLAILDKLIAESEG